jgi:glycerol-3-phosphate acyltransferase PlsY
MFAAGTFFIVDIFIFHQHHPALITLSIFIGAFVLYTHRKNIRRLLHGQEPRFLYKSGKK